MADTACASPSNGPCPFFASYSVEDEDRPIVNWPCATRRTFSTDAPVTSARAV